MRWPWVSRGRYDDLRTEYTELKQKHNDVLALFCPALAPPSPATTATPEPAEETTSAQPQMPRNPRAQINQHTRKLAREYQAQAQPEAIRSFLQQTEREVAAVQAEIARQAEEKKQAEAKVEVS